MVARASVAGVSADADALSALRLRGQRRWPVVAVSDAAWTAGVDHAGIAPDDGTDRADELYLSIAAGLGDAAAIALVRDSYLRPVLGALAKRYQLSAADADDALQRLSAKLWVAAPPRTPAIFDYQGTGALGVWLHVVAMRELISTHRHDQRAAARLGDDDVLAAFATPGVTALLVERRECQALVKQAYEAAIASLTPRQRLLLRMHICSRVSLDALAESYQVNRVTIARWLDRARRDVAAHTRAVLSTTLQVPPDELDSVLREAQSQFELSVERLLESP